MLQVRQGKYAPVYLLHGEEEYYINYISQFILEHALQPEERDFNQDIMYGSEIRANDIINAARQFPIMSEHRVVCIREFQSLTNKETLSSYVQNPMPSTVLILCHKHGTLDGRKGLYTEIKKTGIIMESKRVYENMLPNFINQYASEQQICVDNQAVHMLCEHVGNDLTRMASEIDKLKIALPQGTIHITAAIVEQHTGISKEYNNFELQNALAKRDVVKANQIVKYFHNSPKNFALPLTLSCLFTFFSDVLLTYYAPEQDAYGIAQWLAKPEWMVKQGILDAQKNYTGRKVIDILAKIRQTDAKSKGIGNVKTSPGELLQELICFILY